MRVITGATRLLKAQVLLITPKEVEYFRHGGILQYVLRQLAKNSGKTKTVNCLE